MLRDAALSATVSLRDEVGRAPAGADPARHRQPAGQRDAWPPSCCASYLEANGVAVRALRQGAGAGEPRRADPRLAATGRGSRCSRTRTPCSPIRPSGSVDPWSGELRDGEVWGRGALDMKGQVAASAVAIASLAREGFEPAGDLIFVAAADEEVGRRLRARVARARSIPEAVRAEYSLNEGAGERRRARRPRALPRVDAPRR